MSLFNSLKKALGFPEEYDQFDDDENRELVDDLDDPAPAARAAAPSYQPHVPVRPRLQEEHGEENEGWRAERQQLMEDNERLRSQYYSIKQKSEEYQSKALSADRQKRALSERLRDLEGTLATAESDREQYQLENRSLLNKIRVASLRQESSDDNEALNQLSAKNLELTDQVKKLTAELKEAQNSEKIMSIALVPAQDEVKDLKEKLDKERELTAKADEQLARLKADNEMLQRQVESASKLEQQLRDEIARLSEMIQATATQQPAQPRQPKRRKSKKHAAEIDQTPLDLGLEPPKPLKISAIDELMDDTDWFIAPDPVPLKKDPEVDEDFGYKEPVAKKTSRDDDKQLSLF